MSTLIELETQYFEIENEYAGKQFIAYSKGYTKKEKYWEKKREMNTHAYFLFLFTRLEFHIKEEASNLITKRKGNIMHWKTKAIYYITDPKYIHFKNKLALLTEAGGADYNLILQYYNHRNIIAHGGTITGINAVISMTNVFNDVKRFYKNLKR